MLPKGVIRVYQGIIRSGYDYLWIFQDYSWITLQLKGLILVECTILCFTLLLHALKSNFTPWVNNTYLILRQYTCDT